MVLLSDNCNEYWWSGDHQGCYLEYDSNSRIINDLKNNKLDVQYILSNIDKAYESNLPVEGLKFYCFDLQYTTGIYFPDDSNKGYHIGGGYSLAIVPEWNFEEILQVCVEWNDSWIEENNIEGRDSQINCIKIGVKELNKFLRII